MDENSLFKDNFLIPLMRKKIIDLYGAIMEMEATILYQNNKIKELSEKIASAQNDAEEEEKTTTVSRQRKKNSTISSNPDGGTY